MWRRKICKDCCNIKKLAKLKDNLQKIDTDAEKTCNICNIVKKTILFSRSGISNICIDCSNIKRRERYDNNEELRKKACKQAIELKRIKKQSDMK